MKNYELEILEMGITHKNLNIALKIKIPYNPKVKNPKITVVFQNKTENRRMPLLIQTYSPDQELKYCTIIAKYVYKIDFIFFEQPLNDCFEIYFDLMYGKLEIKKMEIKVINDLKLENINVFKDHLIVVLKASEVISYNRIKRKFFKRMITITNLKKILLKFSFKVCSKTKIKKNRVVFISNRRNDLSGNLEYVYQILKENKKLELRFLLDNRSIREMSLKNIWLFGYYCAVSKIILIDDHISHIYDLPRRKGTKLIQLWHACGAFKTFGFSRLGKQGAPNEESRSHRNYDFAIVSSQNVAEFYAEGFGLSMNKIMATGIPRTDIFFDEAYERHIRKKFYFQYPKFHNKRILLFAPTFRGNGKLSGYYPMDQFNPVELYEALEGEYIILLKYHPYIRNKVEIPEKYADYILDLSYLSELNDLLFVCDVLITDYSSVVFEASLLNIPMLIYAYDLEEYIDSRGFYYEFEDFVPGKIVHSIEEIVTAIQKEDFETDKSKNFKHKFFDHIDGKSSQRVADLIYKLIDY